MIRRNGTAWLLAGAFVLCAWACDSEPMPPPPNACGGEVMLEAAPGTACGSCGEWACDGPDALRCEGDDPNVCGGCGELAGALGEACGECSLGTLECDGEDVLRCVGGGRNSCGGCGSLSATPGDACTGPCGAGALECDGEDALACVSPPPNACGGCTTLPQPIGEPCGTCGALGCDGEDALACEEGPACRLGAACSLDETCASGRCSNSRCVPEGWAFVPSGTFTMGAPPTERGFHPRRENGQHTVTLTRSFLAKETTVTQGEWFALLGTRPSYFANCGDDCPVERVSWWEMVRYADLLSASEGLEVCYGLTDADCTGELGAGCAPDELRCTDYWCDVLPEASYDCLGYRLPTEAEWEYMARAGTTTAFLTASGDLTIWPSSPPDPELDLIAWYAANSQVTYSGGIFCTDTNPDCGPHPVALKEPNNWGLYDMTGNVWERVFDFAGDYPPPGSSVVDPTGPATGTQRRLRGGPFNAWGQYMRVAYRTGPAPQTRSYNNGFRLVRTFPVSD